MRICVCRPKMSEQWWLFWWLGCWMIRTVNVMACLSASLFIYSPSKLVFRARLNALLVRLGSPSKYGRRKYTIFVIFRLGLVLCALLYMRFGLDFCCSSRGQVLCVDATLKADKLFDVFSPIWMAHMFEQSKPKKYGLSLDDCCYLALYMGSSASPDLAAG